LPISRDAAPVERERSVRRLRLASDSASNKVRFRILRPAPAGGKYSAVASEARAPVATSGNQCRPRQGFSTRGRARPGRLSALDKRKQRTDLQDRRASSHSPELWTPQLAHGRQSCRRRDRAGPGRRSNCYQLPDSTPLPSSPRPPGLRPLQGRPSYHDYARRRPRPHHGQPREPSLRTLTQGQGVKATHLAKTSGTQGECRLLVQVTGYSPTVNRRVAGPPPPPARSIKAKAETSERPEAARSPRRRSPWRLAPRPGKYVLRLVGGTTGNHGPVQAGENPRSGPRGFRPGKEFVDSATISLAKWLPAARPFGQLPAEGASWVPNFHFLALPKTAR